MKLKKTVFIVLLFFICLLPSFAQSQKIYMGIEAIPQAYRAVYLDKNYYHLEITSYFTPGFSTGIPVQFGLNNKWLMKSGIYYSDFSYKEILQGLVNGPQIDPRAGIIDSNFVYGDIANRYNIKALEIPAEVLYKFSEKNNSFFICGGFSIQYLIDKRKTPEIDYDGKTVRRWPTTKTDKLNDFNLFGSLGLGYRYNFSDKILLQGEPIVRFSLTKTRSQSFLPERLLIAGFNIGLHYALK